MRIAIGIEDVERSGGQERVICELLWNLADRHEIDLICFRAADIPADKINVVLIPDRLPFSLFLRCLWFIPTSWRRTRGQDYDVILSQGANMWNQSVVLAHTCQAERIRHRREVEWRNHPPSWTTRLQYAIRDPIFRFLERRTIDRCRGRIIVVGEVLKRALQDHYGLADSDVTVADNGVDHHTFHPGLREQWRLKIRRQFGLSDDVFVVLFMGGRWYEKGLSLLMEAVSKMDVTATKLVVVGQGDEEEYGRRAEALDIRDRVVFAGTTPHPERFYATADCFAFLSQTEGFGLVQVEAAACGLPLVVLEGETPSRLMEDGVTGFVAPPDATAIASRLDTLARDPEFCRQAGQISHERSLFYTWQRQADTIETMFEAMMNDE